MTLHVYTICLKRPGAFDEPDLLDVTRGTGGPAGSPFAPTWELLHPALAKLRQGGDAAAEGWAWYAPRYLAEMRVSCGRMPPALYGQLEREAVDRGVVPCPEAWRALIARDNVVLGCHCTAAQAARGWCHRVVLGRRILPALGAVWCGELPAASAPAQGRLPGVG